MTYFNWDNPDPIKVLEYIRIHGKRGMASVDILSKGLHFLDAWNTMVGFELLCDLVKRHGELLEKIVAVEDPTKEERVEYKILTDLIHKWAAKIAKYNQAMREINGKIEKAN
jgi:hypothetical protein